MTGTLDHARRLFACLCARRAAEVASVAPSTLIATAESFLAGTASADDLAAAQRSAAGAVTGAGMVGLRHCSPSATAFLSAFHTCDADAEKAANQAADYALKTARFKEAELRAKHWVWPEDTGEPWRDTQRTAAWLVRFGRDLEPVERAVRAEQRRMFQSVVAAGSGRGKVVPFVRPVSRARNQGLA